MATKIEWCDETWNPVRMKCTRVSEGCKHCYALKMLLRLQGNGCYPQDLSEPVLNERVLMQPLRWRKPRKVFVMSMGDLFHEDVPFKFIGRVLDVIKLCSIHRFMILTKRPERMMKDFSDLMPQFDISRYSHIWLGVTAENQEQADKRIPILLNTPAAHRFISLEPMLGEVDLTQIKLNERTGEQPYYMLDVINGTSFCARIMPPGRDMGDIKYRGGQKLDLVIVGGESGAGRNSRPLHPEWVRKVRDDCEAAGVHFHFKQWGMYNQNGEYVGKKEAGRELDGKVYD